MNGDFLGFSFNGIHSSHLGITRVSDGNRYNELLVPEIENKIVPIPGKDGSYFFGTQYRNKTINLSIAFDSMNERQFRQLTRLLSIKKPCRLIFDERPYKVYIAKISSPPQLNYICFDELQHNWESHEIGDGYIPGSIDHKVYTDKRVRTYKGEGTIEFVCTQPYAIEQFKTLDKYGDYDFYSSFYEEGNSLVHYQKNQSVEIGNVITEYTNIGEWAEASGILPYDLYNSYHIDTVQTATGVSRYNYFIPVYNPGDIDAPFYLYLPYSTTGPSVEGTLNAGSGNPKILINMGSELMVINPFTAKSVYNDENGVMINTHAHVIEGVVYDSVTETWSTTGNIYNEHILAGDFGLIESSDWNIFTTWDYKPSIYINCATGANARIHYNYLYY